MVHVPRPIVSRSVSTREQIARARDGYPLRVTSYEPATPARATVLIHSAMAVPQGFYRRFAEHLAGAGYRVVTYDYRGIAASRPAGSLRGFEASATDWAELDATAVIEHTRRAHPEPLISIGHSFGGQLLGLIDEAHDVDAAILVGAQLGNYRHWPAREWPKLAFAWYGLIPALTAIYGYLPGRWFFGGTDVPAGVAREWARWCRSRGYIVAGVAGAAERFARLAAPTLVYSFTDDWFAPEPSVEALLDRLGGAPLRHRRVAPEQVGVDAIGHFGFFRDGVERTLWRELVEHLDAVSSGLDSELGELRLPRPLPRPTAEFWSISEQELLADLSYGR